MIVVVICFDSVTQFEATSEWRQRSADGVRDGNRGYDHIVAPRLMAHGSCPGCVHLRATGASYDGELLSEAQFPLAGLRLISVWRMKKGEEKQVLFTFRR